MPIAILLLLAFAEMSSGEPSGVQHLLEAAPLLLLLVAGWLYPRATGMAILGLAVILLAAWLFFVLTSGTRSQDTPLLVWIGAGVLLFGLPMAAGWLYLKAASGARR